MTARNVGTATLAIFTVSGYYYCLKLHHRSVGFSMSWTFVNVIFMVIATTIEMLTDDDQYE